MSAKRGSVRRGDLTRCGEPAGVYSFGAGGSFDVLCTSKVEWLAQFLARQVLMMNIMKEATNMLIDIAHIVRVLSPSTHVSGACAALPTRDPCVSSHVLSCTVIYISKLGRGYTATLTTAHLMLRLHSSNAVHFT